MLPLLTLGITVVLACFALGLLELPARVLEQSPDARGNRFSGTYYPSTDEFEGRVQVLFTGGQVYEGDFSGHRFNGYGVLRGEDVDEEGLAHLWRFEGLFVNGRLEGEGIYADTLGTYTGTFVGSLPHGRGSYSSSAGWRYEGEFKHGSMTGQGTVFLADGSSSSGVFEDGVQVSTTTSTPENAQG